MRYWVKSGEKVIGPYSPEDLKTSAILSPDTLVAPEGATSPAAWRPANSYEELQGILAKPPAPPSPSPREAQDMNRCSQCGAKNEADADFCDQCGNALEKHTNAPTDANEDAGHCPECGGRVEEVNGVVGICSQCGAKLRMEVTAPSIKEDIATEEKREGGNMWKCKQCGEEVEANFEICWNCQTDRDKSSSVKGAPASSTEAVGATSSPRRSSRKCDVARMPTISSEIPTAQMTFMYKVLPFFPVVKVSAVGQFASGQIASQLNSLIQQHAVDGWEFYRLDKVDVYGKPGCLGMLLSLFGMGHGHDVNFQYDVATFRKLTTGLPAVRAAAEGLIA